MGDDGAGTTRAANGAVRLAYEDLGPPGGAPLLMVIGLGASRFWWPPGWLSCLQDHGFRPAVFDLRDCGESTHVPRGTAARGGRAVLRGRPPAYRAEDLADDAAAVLDALGWPAAHVFGLSFGGVVAQRLALRHPDRVRTLTVFAAGPSDAGTLAVAWRYLRWGTQARLLRLTLRARKDPDVAAAVLRLTATPGYPADEEEARAATARDRAHGLAGFQDMAAQARLTGARWRGPALSELRKPVLVMCGGADPVLRPRASRDIAAAVPGARLVVLPGVGHGLPRAVWPTVAGEMRALAEGAG